MDILVNLILCFLIFSFRFFTYLVQFFVSPSAAALCLIYKSEPFLLKTALFLLFFSNLTPYRKFYFHISAFTFVISKTGSPIFKKRLQKCGIVWKIKYLYLQIKKRYKIYCASFTYALKNAAASMCNSTSKNVCCSNKEGIFREILCSKLHKIKKISKSQTEIKKHTFYNHTVLEKFIYCGRMRTGKCRFRQEYQPIGLHQREERM